MMNLSWDSLKEVLGKDGWTEPVGAVLDGEGEPLVGMQIYVLVSERETAFPDSAAAAMAPPASRMASHLHRPTAPLALREEL
eukprot:SAG31_NODE_1581_length_7834_cov_11.737298_1_plen_82_part_00